MEQFGALENGATKQDYEGPREKGGQITGEV
jgi:hypothetical protein